jgi:hypothetical protein
MWLQLYDLISRLATWPVGGLLVIGIGLCLAGFRWRQRKFGPQMKLLDTRIFYTPADVKKLLEALGKQGRQLYAATQLSLDLVFPLLYALLLAILLLSVHEGEIERKLIVFPLLAMCADILENITIAYLALTFNEKESVLAWVSAMFTATKWIAWLLWGSAFVMGVIS